MLYHPLNLIEQRRIQISLGRIYLVNNHTPGIIAMVSFHLVPKLPFGNKMNNSHCEEMRLLVVVNFIPCACHVISLVLVEAELLSVAFPTKTLGTRGNNHLTLQWRTGSFYTTV